MDTVNNILGISAYYHDSAAAVLSDGNIVSAAQEERFTRKKHDSRFPVNSIRFCLENEKLDLKDIDAIVFYDKPFLKFDRLLETYIAYAPLGLESFVAAMPVWLKEKLYLKQLIKRELANIGNCKMDKLPKLMFTEHHHSHAASAFYPGPFDEAAVLCLDGVGEWATTSAWHGLNNSLSPLWELHFPHSLGLLYSAFTYFCGFKVNSGEYKLMGLAPYGEPLYTDLILEHLLDLKPDGTFRMDMRYFDYPTGLKMTNWRFAELFGGQERHPESPITRREMNIAASIQKVTEEIVLRLSRTLQKETGSRNLCLAGGVALNCVANGKVRESGDFNDIWIQPAAGDAGGAIGAALAAWYEYYGCYREAGNGDTMSGSYLGPAYSNDDIKEFLDSVDANYQLLETEILLQLVAGLLTEENVIGWFRGRMEFGPRALGNRSIIGDPRSSRMQSTMNLKIKFRESFRPFAPAVMEEFVSEYFCLEGVSPYMLLVASVKNEHRLTEIDEQKELSGFDRLSIPRSDIPAVTHVDYTARVQTVQRKTNPEFHRLLDEFRKLTGCPVLVNTSFNVRGEPIVCTPEDAYRCFMRTNIDYLVLGDYLIAKKDQKELMIDDSWREEFELD